MKEYAYIYLTNASSSSIGKIDRNGFCFIEATPNSVCNNTPAVVGAIISFHGNNFVFIYYKTDIKSKLLLGSKILRMLVIFHRSKFK